MPVKAASSQVPSGRCVLEQVLDPAADGVAAGAAGGDQPEDGPGGLRGGRLAPAHQRRVVVARAGLAPAAVGLLDRLEPVGGLDAARGGPSGSRAALRPCRTCQVP